MPFKILSKSGDLLMTGTRTLENAPTGREDVTVSHREKLVTELRDDPELTAAYLNAAAEDGDPRVYLAALGIVSQVKVEGGCGLGLFGTVRGENVRNRVIVGYAHKLQFFVLL